MSDGALVVQGRGGSVYMVGDGAWLPGRPVVAVPCRRKEPGLRVKNRRYDGRPAGQSARVGAQDKRYERGFSPVVQAARLVSGRRSDGPAGRRRTARQDRGRRLGPEIARGKEHRVYHRSGSEWVTKVPRFVPLWMLNHLFGGPWKVVEEVAETTCRVAKSGGKVQLPTTIILFTRKGYEIRQAYVEGDDSVPDIPRYLHEAGLSFLAARATVSVDNFLTREGVVYAIDPTGNPYYRLLKVAAGHNDEIYMRFVSVMRRFFWLRSS
jgi:hypothetical protein